MCPFPGESRSGVRPNDLIRQFEGAFDGDCMDNYELITLFCNGNFFSDRELDPQVRNHIFERIGASQAALVAVESLPQFLTEAKVAAAGKNLGSKKLAVFMGLQSANDFVREVAVNTTCTRPAFEKAVRILQAHNHLPVAFLMVKPPFLTETEAMEDTLASLVYLSRLGVTHSTLCPTRVAPGTLLSAMHAMDYYQPGWIWSVVEILKRNADASGSVPMVNTSELKDWVNPDSRCAHACPDCQETLISALEEFLLGRDPGILRGLRCHCYAEYQRHLQSETKRWGNVPLPDRVEQFLQLIQVIPTS
jgi:radical SAM enzyme (TIGR01210 family)